jgi:hypothetical protein
VLDRPKTGFSVPVRQWLGHTNDRDEHRLRGWAKTIYRKFVDG